MPAAITVATVAITGAVERYFKKLLLMVTPPWSFGASVPLERFYGSVRTFLFLFVVFG